ncbi:peptidyl-prolyl cis-trans isomerase [Podospora conica]|nr:peptidyl-prolyl cis-trans isomerase [Schizothecium conicum]
MRLGNGQLTRLRQPLRAPLRPHSFLPPVLFSSTLPLPTKLHQTSQPRQSFSSSTPSLYSAKMPLPQLDGLQIEVTQEGSGPETQRGNTISVHYRGTLTNGNKFDSSYDRGSPLDFTVGQGQVIKGWDEGLLGMKVGEKRKLTIAPELAYGNRAVGGVIPANSTLIFETELVKIK